MKWVIITITSITFLQSCAGKTEQTGNYTFELSGAEVFKPNHNWLEPIDRDSTEIRLKNNIDASGVATFIRTLS